MAVRHGVYAAAAGALSMYLLDPDHGRRRRSMLRDRLTSGVRRFDAAASVAVRDLGNRTRGLAHEVRSRLADEPVEDEVLCERVRARLGSVVSHPGTVEVEALQGRVTLGGAVLEREYVRLLRAVWAVRGVADVEDRLAVYEEGQGVVAAPQGRGGAAAALAGAAKESWPPGLRLVLGATGALLASGALTRRGGLVGGLGRLAGLALLVRSATNLPIDRLAGVRATAVEIDKCIEVAAPVEQVFEAFAQPERLPRLMSHVREVRVRGDGTSHWVVEGPAGRTVSWDAMTTRLETNQLVAWRTLPGSAVEHAGVVRFEPSEAGTRVRVTMSYTPPGGPIGHAVAALFGADPKSELDDDLLRLKVFLETGRAARDAAAPH
jgi:uncharacterized membrane protein